MCVRRRALRRPASGGTGRSGVGHAYSGNSRRVAPGGLSQRWVRWLTLAWLVAFAVGCDGNVDKSLGSYDRDGSQPVGGGCGVQQAAGVHTLFVTSSGYDRSFHVSVPDDYDPTVRYPLVFGFHNGNRTGLAARDDLGLEEVDPKGWALFVYPNARAQEFEDGRVVAAGWQNGPATTFYGGSEDITFVADILDKLEAIYCVDTSASFATGHSWGGEFSAVIGCYMARQFLGIAPMAANAPYYLPFSDPPPCTGSTAAWVFHGKGDGFFPLHYGEDQLSFWLGQNDCGTTPTQLLPEGAGSDDDCAAYSCNGPTTRSCWYDSSLSHGDIPSYHAAAAVSFFQGLL